MGTIDVEAWQTRLEQTFQEDGISGLQIAEIALKETAYGKYVRERFNGYRTLAESFQTFFYDTLAHTLNQYRYENATKEAPYHCLYLVSQLTVFRSIRAAENLLYRGYPLDGLSLLRDIKDRAVFFAAWISGFTSWRKLYATDRLPAKDDTSIEASRAWRRAVEREENRILKLMLRENSDFEEPVKSDLQRWEDFFNLELHGSRFTTVQEFGGWMKREESVSVAPVPKDRSVAGYCNHAAEVIWMLHRTLPFLQLMEGTFGNTWTEKWTVLDDSFRLYQLSFEEQGNSIATAVRAFIDRRFQFTPATIYIERNQSASVGTG